MYRKIPVTISLLILLLSIIYIFFFRREITELKFENIIFETILERKKFEPIPHHISSAVPRTSSSQATTPINGSIQNHDLLNASGTSRNDRSTRKRSRSRSTQAELRVQLTLEQKLEFITSEYELTRNEKLRHEIEHEKQIDQLEVCHFHFKRV